MPRGQVGVVSVDGALADTMGDGDVFGEMALPDRATRSATVRALEETELDENYPTLAECYKVAGLNAANKLRL